MALNIYFIRARGYTGISRRCGRGTKARVLGRSVAERADGRRRYQSQCAVAESELVSVEAEVEWGALRFPPPRSRRCRKAAVGVRYAPWVLIFVFMFLFHNRSVALPPLRWRDIHVLSGAGKRKERSEAESEAAPAVSATLSPSEVLKPTSTDCR